MFKSQTLQKIIRFGVYLALLTPLVYIPQTIFPTIFGKMIYFQIIIELTLPFFIYLIIFHKEFRPKLDWLTKIILLFFAALFVSSLLGVDFVKSFWGYDERMRGIFALLHPLLLYFYIIACYKNRKDQKKLLFFVILVGLAVSIYGIVERINPSLGIAKGIFKSEKGHRVMSTTGNSIFLGGYMIFTAFISLYYYLFYRDNSRWLGLAGFLLSSLTLLFTGSRGAFLGFMGGIIIFLFFSFLLAGKKKKIKIGATIGIIIILFLLAVVFNINGLAKNKYWDFKRLTDISLKEASAAQRLILWKISLKAFKPRPILGWGLENFDYAFDKNYEPELLKFGVNQTWADRAHNIFLDLLVMGGIIGLASYLAIFIYIFYRFLKRQHFNKLNAVFLGLFSGFLCYSFFGIESPSINLMLFFSFALCYLIFNNNADQRIMRSNESINKNRYFVFLFSCFLVFLSIFFFNIKPLYAGMDFIKFRHTDNIQTKKALAEKFLDARSPYRNSLRQRFANQMFLEAGESNNLEYLKWGLNRAAQEIELSREEHEQEFSYPFTLGNLYLRRASVVKDVSYDKAIFYYKKALELSPKRQPVTFQLATAYLLNGEAQKAVDILREAISYDETMGQPHWRLGIALLANNKQQEAYKSFKNSIKLFFYGKIENEIKSATNLCIEYKDYKCAAILYKELGINPETAEFYFLLAEAHVEMGDYGGARTFMLHAVKLDPSLKTEAEKFLKNIKNKI